jgi:hypothetical protein
VSVAATPRIASSPGEILGSGGVEAVALGAGAADRGLMKGFTVRR